MSSSKRPRDNSFCISCFISDFSREVDEHCALLCCYAASSGISLPTFRDLGSPETSARNYYYTLRNSPEERSSVDNCCSGNYTAERYDVWGMMCCSWRCTVCNRIAERRKSRDSWLSELLFRFIV